MNLTGYHGTNKSSANRIKLKGFKDSVNGWFGKGAYFYKGNQELAKKWAEKNFPDSKKVIIEGQISVNENKIFDVRSPESEDSIYFHEYRNALIKKIESEGNINRNSFDNLVFSMILKGKNKDLVLGNSFTYDNGPPSRIPNGVEICVINKSLINILRWIEI